MKMFEIFREVGITAHFEHYAACKHVSPIDYAKFVILTARIVGNEIAIDQRIRKQKLLVKKLDKCVTVHDFRHQMETL